MPRLRDVRLAVFRCRGLSPIPLVAALAILSRPTYAHESTLDIVFDSTGLAVIALGLALRAWAVAHAGRHTRSYKLRAPALVCSGPYAHVRNPIYVGNLLIGLGLVIMAESLVGLGALLVLFALEYGAIVSLEEEFLAREFGERYEEYRRNVRPWVPRLVAWGVESAPRGALHRALRKEHRAVLSAVAMAAIVQLGKELPRWLMR